MKEKIQKMAEAQAKALVLLKEAKTEEAVVALEETANIMAELEADASVVAETVEKQTAELDELKKSAEVTAVEIKKWSELTVVSDNLPKLFDELKAISGAIGTVTDITKSAATSDSLSAIEERLEAIEKAGNSRQLIEQHREVAKSRIGIDLKPN